MTRIDDPELVAREYASLDRLRRRRIDVTGWLRFGEDDEWSVLLRAIAEVRPRRVLDAGCGDGTLASMVPAPEVVCVDRSAGAVEAARARGLEARRGIAELVRVLRAAGRFVGICVLVAEKA